MRRVTTASGREFAGANRAAVVRAMRDDAWMSDETKSDYMESVADRVEQQTGFKLGTSVDDFIEGLTGLGYVVEEVMD